MQQEEISLKDLWKLFTKHAFKIFSLILLGIILAIAFMILFVTPNYRSTAQLLVNQSEERMGQSPIQYSELQANSQLINTYRDIITGDSVLNRVSDDANKAYSVGDLKDAITVEQSPNSQAFYVSVQLESPQAAQNVLYNVITVFEETVSDIYGGEDTNIFILSPASFNPNRVSPSLPIYSIIGALMGLAIAILIILLSEISDTTVKDDEFMASLGMNDLGHIYQLSNKEMKSSRIASSKSQKRTRKKV
ncbi:YveK family protein [Facklamia sp. P12955]|uniref:YveK family protein n=1 Tax=unclassified Facklamia TaxID=2622293 RepID=UPI003D1861A3